MGEEMSDNIDPEIKLFVKDEVDTINAAFDTKANKARNQALTILGTVAVILTILGYVGLSNVMNDAVDKAVQNKIDEKVGKEYLERAETAAKKAETAYSSAKTSAENASTEYSSAKTSAKNAKSEYSSAESSATKIKEMISDLPTRFAEKIETIRDQLENDLSNRLKDTKNELKKDIEFIKPKLHMAYEDTRVVLLHNNEWADFPGLHLEIELKKESFVLAYYQVSMKGGGDNEKKSHLVTRLKLGVEELPQRRAIHGNTSYWSPSSLWSGNLKGGTHSFRVQYRTPAGGIIKPFENKWEKRVLYVMVFGG